MVPASSCPTSTHTNGKCTLTLNSSSAQLLQRMLFHRTMGEEVVENIENSNVCSRALCASVLFSHKPAVMRLSAVMASFCLCLTSKMASMNINFREWK